jgi:hypothetical protein
LRAAAAGYHREEEHQKERSPQVPLPQGLVTRLVSLTIVEHGSQLSEDQQAVPLDGLEDWLVQRGGRRD